MHCCCSLRLLCAGRLAPPPSVVGAWVRRSNGRGGVGRREGARVTMQPRHLHKIGPSDTPISSSSPPTLLPSSSPPLLVWAGLACLAGELRRGTACRLPGTRPGTHTGAQVLGVPPHKTRSSAPWPVQAQPGPSLIDSPAPQTTSQLEQLTTHCRRSPGLGTTLPDLFVDGNLA